MTRFGLSKAVMATSKRLFSHPALEAVLSMLHVEYLVSETIATPASVFVFLKKGRKGEQ